MEDFDFLMFGGAEVERDAEEAEEFNERWNRLVEIQGDMLDEFLFPVLISDELTASDSADLEKCLGELVSWFDAINGNLENVRRDRLSGYAAAIAEAAVKAIRLCGKYGVYGDIQSVEYVSRREMIVVNGEDLWFLA